MPRRCSVYIAKIAPADGLTVDFIDSLVVDVNAGTDVFSGISSGLGYYDSPCSRLTIYLQTRRGSHV
jgi:hypothetical protein